MIKNIKEKLIGAIGSVSGATSIFGSWQVCHNLYVKKRCISSRLIMFNTGLIIAGIPFQPLQAFSKFFWLAGGALAVAGIFLFVKDKIQKRRVKV